MDLRGVGKTIVIAAVVLVAFLLFYLVKGREMLCESRGEIWLEHEKICTVETDP